MCDSVYNCYQTSEKYIESLTPWFSVSLTHENPKLESILKEFRKQYVTNTYFKNLWFKIVLRVNGTYKSRILCFNHSFILHKQENEYELCDSWAGIHPFYCRKRDFIKWFDNLIDDLKDFKISKELIEFFESAHDLPEGEWINKFPCPRSQVPGFSIDISVYY